MKKTLVVTLLIAFFLTACGGASPTTASPAPPTAAADDATGNTAPPAPATESAAAGATTNSPDATGNTANSTEIPSAGILSNPPNPSTPSDCTDSASFVSDVTVQDNETFQPGEKFQKVWRIKNTGDCAWSNAYSLVFQKGNRMGAPASSPLKDTQPGGTLDIAVDLTAPSDGNTGRVRADFEIHTPSGAAVPIDQSAILWVIIQVSNDISEVHGNGETGGSPAPAASAGSGYAAATCAYTTNQANADAVFAALNAYRSQQGLPAYRLNARLSEAAQAHSADMACNSLFYHNGSNGSTAKSRVAASGYIASFVTENVYGSYPPLTGAEAIIWWASDLTDPRHNENLLSTKYIEVGIGYAFFNNFGYYVIDFAVP